MFGVGITLAALLMQISYYTTLRLNVENEARKMGMVYPTEQKVLGQDQKEDGGND
ncbi:MAG: hypothetical protein ACOWWR_03865 [Eubacteriales bacterium]